MSTTNLLEAIRTVKENERLASESYADAAKKISHTTGKWLFEQLSEFEKFHFERLSVLVKSLEEKGDFITYEGKEFLPPPIFEITAAKEPYQKSVITIILEAIELERQAEKTYSDLAAELTDEQGHEFFSRLSEEEHIHYRILSEAHWSLTNFGFWKWSHRFPMIWVDKDKL